MKRILIVTLLAMSFHVLFPQLPMIIAHRGASYDAPENTLAAVSLAWEKGADAVEIDVHLSSDQQIIVIHDKSTKRTTDQNYEVKETPSETLRTLDAGSWKDEAFSGEKIPFLEEVMATVPEGKKLFIEVKCGPEIIPVLTKQIESSGIEERLVIISFHFEVVKQSREVMPGIPAFFLHYTLTRRYGKDWITKAREANLSGLNFRYRGITPSFTHKVHAAGMKMFAWTVDDPKEALRLTRLGIDGITTNRPAWLREELVRLREVRDEG